MTEEAPGTSERVMINFSRREEMGASKGEADSMTDVALGVGLEMTAAATASRGMEEEIGDSGTITIETESFAMEVTEISEETEDLPDLHAEEIGILVTLPEEKAKCLALTAGN